MVRLICLLKRKPGMTVDEFHDHWQHRHGPLVRSTASIARHVVYYEQYLPADSPIPLGKEFDGVTVMGFAAADDFVAFVSEPDYAAVIAPDEKRFLDLDGLVGIMVDDPSTVMGADDPSTVMGADEPSTVMGERP